MLIFELVTFHDNELECFESGRAGRVHAICPQENKNVKLELFRRVVIGLISVKYITSVIRKS